MSVTETEKRKAWDTILNYCHQCRGERDALQLDTCDPAVCVLKRINKGCFCYGSEEPCPVSMRKIADHEVCQAVKIATFDCKYQLMEYGRWENCKCILKDMNKNICPLRPGNLFLAFLQTWPNTIDSPETLLHKIFRSCRKDHAICNMTKKK